MLNRLKFKILLMSGFLWLSPALALAESELPGQVRSLAVNLIWITALIVAILVLVAITRQKLTAIAKTELFWGIAAPVILISLFLAGTAIYFNIVSATKGPVHWHADFRIYNCGQEIDLADPTGLSNRIGTPLFHEHDDGRIHVEGAVLDEANLTLGSFFKTIGGQVSPREMILPTNDGYVRLASGDFCVGGDPAYENRLAQLQVYLYRTEGRKVIQEKLVDWPNYVLSPQPDVPPGDCIIFELNPDIRGQTRNICPAYLQALRRGIYIADNF